MPYKLKKTGKGYKVCKKVGGKCFSKKPLPKKRAMAQMRAIAMNEDKKTPLELLFIEACWKGYKQVGMKKKGNRMIPNCVPKKSKIKR